MKNTELFILAIFLIHSVCLIGGLDLKTYKQDGVENTQDEKGDTRLHRLAAQCATLSDLDVARFMVKYEKTNPFIENNDGNTARKIAEYQYTEADKNGEPCLFLERALKQLEKEVVRKISKKKLEETEE